jgi:hypothetical protein
MERGIWNPEHMNRLTAKVRRRDQLAAGDTGRMYALYSAYYTETSASRFAADLAAKDYVIELAAHGELIGFSTVALLEFRAGGAARRAIYSGDTIIDHRHWGEQTLAVAFCRLAGAVKAADPAMPLYWFLITKGHRTYRYLGAFSREYYPHPSRPTPALAAQGIDALARAKFGAAWKPELGIVRFERSQGQLRAPWTEARPSLAARAAVRFFLERNPGHARGDELCCLTELAAPNLRSCARRAFLEGYDEATRSVSLDRRVRGPLPAAAAVGAHGPAAAPALDPRG